MTFNLARRTAIRLGLCSMAATGAAACTSGSQQPGLPLDASAVPIAGGFVMPDAPYVITQPTAGDYHAFLKSCTHAGCSVTRVDTSGIVCSCHDSVFSATDGSVISGPAPKPLARATIRASAGKVYLSA